MPRLSDKMAFYIEMVCLDNVSMIPLSGE